MLGSAYKLLSRSLLQLMLPAVLWLCSAAAVQAQVLITGIDAKTQANVRAYLRLDDEACDAPAWRVQRLFAEADAEILEALEVVGYYSASVDKKIEQGKKCWQATFNIVAGQPVLLRNIVITIDTGAAPDPQLQAVAQQCALRAGDVFQHAHYDVCRRQIASAAEDRGYFAKEFFARKVDVYPAEFAADVSLHLITGPRYVFGAVTFDQDVLDEDLVQRFVSVTQGEAYDAERVRRLQRDLVRSTYFDQVVLERQPRGAPYFDVPIGISLTPGKRYQYSVGVGFATDLGPKLRGGFLNRRIGHSGHQAEVDVNLSPVISNIDGSYRVPLNKPRDWVTFDTGYKLEDNDSFESRLFTAGAQRLQQRSNGWVRTLFLELRLEDYETGTVEDAYSKLLTPGIGYSFVAEDYPPRPFAGHRSNVQLRGSVDGLISETSFMQAYGNTKWVFELWPKARLLTRLEAGYTAIGDFRSLPASVRYYAGGDVSVRGYAYNSLGPVNELGDVIGGSNLLVGSVEIDQPIATNWSIAAFADAGNAFDDFGDYEPAVGVGAGIRWFSPLGPIRIDVAVPLKSDAPDNYRLHITLGPDL